MQPVHNHVHFCSQPNQARDFLLLSWELSLLRIFLGGICTTSVQCNEEAFAAHPYRWAARTGKKSHFRTVLKMKFPSVIITHLLVHKIYLTETKPSNSEQIDKVQYSITCALAAADTWLHT